MRILYLHNSSNIEELKKNNNFMNFEYLNIKEYLKNKNQYYDKNCLFIIDKKSVDRIFINEIEKEKSPELIILLNDTLNWDELIETFEHGETYYVKPIKEEDFKDLI